jgi:hypothetical protein
MKTIGNTARTLAGLGVVALALTLSGCIIDASSNGCTADLQVSWSINDTGGQGLTCEQVPANAVQVILDGTAYPSACSDYSARINNIPIGTHSAQLRLLNGSTPVSDTGAMTISLVDCRLYDLNGGTPVPFTVN